MLMSKMKKSKTRNNVKISAVDKTQTVHRTQAAMGEGSCCQPMQTAAINHSFHHLEQVTVRPEGDLVKRLHFVLRPSK